MYIIHEENQSCLCVAENIEKGIMWLIKNDWLNGLTIGVDEDDNEYQMKDIVKDSDRNKYLIFAYFVKLCRKDGMRAVFEWLEGFGIYFNEIEVA